jgi:hypothetical protein
MICAVAAPHGVGRARRGTTRARALYAVDATPWLLDESDHAFSFRWVCSVLDLDADAVRARVERDLPQG